ncbi:MAG: L,D-transpeptidase [Gemmatimonadaceae bacterium]
MRRPVRTIPSLTTLALATAVVACAGRTATHGAAPPRPPDGARQLVVVTTPGWDSTSGTLRRFTRDRASDPWRADGPTVAVVVGRSGLARADGLPADVAGGAPKHEGDGRSPAGAFPLDTAFGFAPRDSVPWVRLPYVALEPGSECVDDGASAHYNTVVDRGAVARVDWASAERMRQVAQYRLGVIVGYNAAPPRPGRGSCIFLHVWAGPGSTTAGCTAFDAGALERVVRWLDPARRPVLVQLPADAYERLRERWRLP